MSRINGKVTHTVHLGQAGIGDKLVIGAAGDISPTAPGADGVVSDVPGGTIVNHGSMYSGPEGSAVGGTGIELQASGTVSNDGMVRGGNGAYYFNGGVGVDLKAGGLVMNSGDIVGGLGGYSGKQAITSGGNGVDLRAGGMLANHGMIAGGLGGYYVYGTGINLGPGGIGVFLGPAASVTNDGTIKGGAGQAINILLNGYNDRAGGGGTGAELAAGSTLTNAGIVAGGAGGYAIYNGGGGSYGIAINGGAVANSGVITGGAGGTGRNTSGGNGGAGVSLEGGTLTNTGGIVGGAGGAYDLGGTPGAAGAGVTMHRGVVVNSGSISGGYNGHFGGGAGGVGVYINGGTLTNSGTITGGIGTPQYGNGDAVKFGTAAATLIVDPNAVFIGNVAGDFVNDTLVLAAGATIGQLDGLGGAAFDGFTKVTEAAGAVWNLTGATSLDAAKMDVAGTLTFTGTVAGHGALTLDSGSSVTADGALGVASVAFAAGGEESLTLGAPTLVTSTLSGFAAGDTIDLVNLIANGVTFSTGTLSLLENTSVVATLALAGDYTSANFKLMSDGHGGTNIFYVAQAASLAPPEPRWTESGASYFERSWSAGHVGGPGEINWWPATTEHGHFTF